MVDYSTELVRQVDMLEENHGENMKKAGISFTVINNYVNMLVENAEKFQKTLYLAQNSGNQTMVR